MVMRADVIVPLMADIDSVDFSCGLLLSEARKTTTPARMKIGEAIASQRSIVRRRLTAASQTRRCRPKPLHPASRLTMLVVGISKKVDRGLLMDACATAVPRVFRGDLSLLPPTEVATLTTIAHALSDPTRVQILWLLEQREELCTCELEELLALGQSRVSYHLGLLLEAGLLLRHRRGTWSHYRLARSGLIACLRALAPGVDASPAAQTKEEGQDGHYITPR